MKRIALVVVALPALLAVGCGGGPNLAPVSGVVTVDGKPYPNAVVSFQPLAQPGSTDTGMGSSAVTDENGRYTLTTIDGKNGATVGKHKVRIQTKRENTNAVVDPSKGSDDKPDDGGRPRKTQSEPIPLEWFSDTGGKEFTVPAGGTDKADFAIDGAKPKKK
jgi:hypothetical protein